MTAPRRRGAAIALAAAVTAGCGDDRAGRDLSPLPETPAFALVAADYRRDAAAVAMLRADGTVITPSWIDSGTTAVGLDTTLSSDVVLPTEPCDAGVLTLIDRESRDVVTRIAVPSGEVLVQLRLVARGPDLPAFSSNPQDVACVDGTGWVPRFGRSREASPVPANAGSDLVPLDLAAGTWDPAARVDLAPWGSEIVHPAPREGRAAPHPSSAVALADGRLLVGLARVDLTTREFGAASGAVVVVDPDGGGVAEVPLPGLANCADVTREPTAPDAPEAAWVSCLGWAASFDGFGDAANRRPTAGLARLVRGEGGGWSVDAIWRGADHPGSPLAVVDPVPLGGRRALAVAWGDPDGARPDALHEVDLGTGAVREVLVADEAFALGSAAVDRETGTILWPDAVRGVRRLRPDGGGFVELDAIPIPGALPARIVAALSPR